MPSAGCAAAKPAARARSVRNTESARLITEPVGREVVAAAPSIAASTGAAAKEARAFRRRRREPDGAAAAAAVTGRFARWKLLVSISRAAILLSPIIEV